MVHPEVEIEQGVLRGVADQDLNGDTFFKFQGIPYAKPPLDELRFKAPQPPEKWSGVLDATKHGNVSYHADPFAKTVVGNEDCLFINVYTKNFDPDSKPRPVLFWIHGGGFFFGSGNEELYGPHFLMTEDVVVVTFNYRLSMFGFATFDDPTLNIPGNAGLKDQVMALKWVQKNIAKFGGDPKNVTIFGESAGATAVHLMVLSPLAKGLFHKAIAQSGSVLNPWAQGGKMAELLGKALGMEGADDKTLYEALKGKNAGEILQVQHKMLALSPRNQPRPLSFVVEKKSPDAFLYEDPVTIMSSGTYNHVPFLTGYTTAEGMIFELLRGGVFDINEMVPWNFKYPTEQLDGVVEKIRQKYLTEDEDSERAYRQKLDVMSDSQFIYGVHATVLTHLKTSTAPIYFYRMSVESKLNFFKEVMKIKAPGASHLDDVGYLFKNFATPEITPGSIEDTSLRRFVKLWTNFARFGEPTPDPKDPLLKVSWKRVSNPRLDFLDIGKDLVASSNPDSERMNFWKQLFEESPAASVN